MSTFQPVHNLSRLRGLYDPSFERENCGIGLIAHIQNKPSKTILKAAIQSLCRMSHRGGLASDQASGDGCGLLMQKPDAFFRRLAHQEFPQASLSSTYAVGMVFLSQNPHQQALAKNTLEQHLNRQNLQILGWRLTPTDDNYLGQQAKQTQPSIQQIFINAPTGLDESSFNRALYVARRFCEMEMEKSTDTDFYIASLHSRTISYKGLMMPLDLPKYYTDLSCPDFAVALCSYHQRFSTNTLPEWRLAQPFRYLAHNGEINSIQGNRNWAQARAKQFHSELLPELNEFKPIISLQGSDSSSLDNMLEAFVMGGLSPIEAMRVLIPPATENDVHLSEQVKAYFRFHSHFVEPWDGPAGVMLHDGRFAICALDRNGLRPSRYVMTKEGIINFASEVGVFDCQAADIVEKGRLRPGQMIFVDVEEQKVRYSEDIVNHLAAQKDYVNLVKNSHLQLETDNPELAALDFSADQLHQYQKYFNVSFEEIDQVLRVLAEDAQEAIGSMGDDAPLPGFSNQQRSLFDFFRQVFAQVTNPPIDSLRETIVMSLETILASEPSIFARSLHRSKRITLNSPVLSPKLMSAIEKQTSLPFTRIELHYPPQQGLEEAIQTICHQAEQAVRNRQVIICLSDLSIQANQNTIHILLAVGAVHHHLIAQGLRTRINLIAESAWIRDPHHFAVTLGYGATAIYPYLAFESIRELYQTRKLATQQPLKSYIKNYLKGINKGILKILSKIGISSISSYRGAQLFEIVGLHQSVVELCFKGSISRISGIGFENLAQQQWKLCQKAFNQRKTIDQGGLLKFVHGGEQHAYAPNLVDLLRSALQQGDHSAYRQFAQLVNNRHLVVRDYLQLTSPKAAIALTEVEPKEAIYKRFDCAGISLGALSPEAHEAIAIAMNSIGARSNSGEGGEDPKRFNTIKNSKIKQVASGRFGVTAAYLMSAEVVQIKIAQGAKPGEGGQLPGNKVDATIARLRYATPGVTLISPPPHHDIYSIEDLAQLIFDLKQVNPRLLVSVKLVSAPGVGTIAAGVAKAYADLITISGYDGGTGASPLTSVKYAGSPFELGLAEARQVLRANDFRDKVRLQIDGGLKTGLDVVKAAILGAESFGFGTAPMIALGCKYLRICHLNICPVGVATQNDELRTNHFHGMPEMIINYFNYLAEEVREILASLGVRSLNEIIGQVHYLKLLESEESQRTGIDLSPLIDDSSLDPDKPQYCLSERNDPWDKGLVAETMLTTVRKAIDERSGGIFNFHINNVDRSIGARISGYIAQHYGNHGLKDTPIIIRLRGVAGQSFGVWNVDGLHLDLEGDANDYVGKGMSGGRLVLYPPKQAQFNIKLSPIMGNTCLYGATGGELYADGTAGERFGVRNSGANAVVLGIGDHGCEYMTGGIVVVLGSIGQNFGAGMSGGCAFLYDPHQQAEKFLNADMVEALNMQQSYLQNQRQLLFWQLQRFVKNTNSHYGNKRLKNLDNEWQHYHFIKAKMMPMETLLASVS